MNGVSQPDWQGVVPGASLVGSPQPLGAKVCLFRPFPLKKAVRPTWLSFPLLTPSCL